MKRFKDLTEDEIFELSWNDIQEIAKRELIAEGVAIVEKPEEPEALSEQDSIKGFTIDDNIKYYGGFIFEKYEDAEEVLNFIKEKSKYFRYVKYKDVIGYVEYTIPSSEIDKPIKEYGTKYKIDTISFKLDTEESREKIDYDRKKQEYERDLKEYEEFHREFKKVLDNLDREHYEVVRKVNKFNSYYNVLINDYLPIVDGDFDKALEVFMLSVKDKLEYTQEDLEGFLVNKYLESNK